MIRGNEFWERKWLLALFLCVAFGGRAFAADYLNLPIVKPVISCDQLAKVDLNRAADAVVTIASAAVVGTPKGQFCKVVGNIQPTIGFEVDLPVEHWTQRYLEGGCGGLCGMTMVGIQNASSCAPALDGEFVVAGNDMGHKGSMGGDDEASFGVDPQKRIDFAYRGNHVTTLVAKALIKSYYGQGPRFSYFTGCSDGGREALMEAQRFPADFDGISAGAPAAIFQIQNSFYHGWNAVSNRRADGTNILLKSRLNILHDAVIAHCPTLSGVEDGVLEDPRVCKFDRGWVQCGSGASDTSKCLTAEEVGVVEKLYEGPTDAAGHHFILGGAAAGSEAQWFLPDSPTGSTMGAGMAERSLKYVMLPTASPDAKDVLSKFSFSEESFQLVSQLAPLYDATNTNLRPFQERGGKLILWHGWSDTSITPAISIAYYQGVQKDMGAELTDKFLRMFLLPGVGHCGGGDGFAQIDTLTPLMAWTELNQDPKVLIGGKVPERPMGPPPPPAPAPDGKGPPTPPPRMFPPPSSPIASPAEKTLATRPIYPYPYIAHYTGRRGDPKDAANYEPVRSPFALPEVFNTEAIRLIGPDNQKNYRVVDGKLVADERK